MAFVGTLFASLVGFPLAFFAARNITPTALVNQLMKRFFDFLRSVDMLIWALFFTRGFGPGPLAGIAAIFFTDTGTLGKLYSEALENIDDKQREGVRSVGASPLQVQRFGVVPQVLPVFAQPGALLLGIEHPLGHHHRRRGRRRHRPQAAGSDAHQPGLGKRRLHGAADPAGRLRLRYDLDFAQTTARSGADCTIARNDVQIGPSKSNECRHRAEVHAVGLLFESTHSARNARFLTGDHRSPRRR